MSGEQRPDPEQSERILHALRAHGIAFGDVGHGFGSKMGLHSTDAAALVQILEAQDRGAPLTQKELGQRIGLTPGATSTLLTRLEDVGHIQRARTSADKRLVTLHASEAVESRVDDYFDPLSERVGALLPNYSPEVLAEFERFLGEVTATMSDYVRESGGASPTRHDPTD
jgi:MarR family transcriptional regulator, organic hydroperoxide resistance regulator